MTTLKRLGKTSQVAKVPYSYSKKLKLKKQYGGLMNVSTPIGQIHLVTDKYLIEVKAFPVWKLALGELLAYSVMYYPGHQKVMALFGKPDSSIIGDIKSVLSKRNIELWLLDD